MIYGFVYLWRDHKNKMFYLGSHHGSEDDDYIGSSRWFRAEHKKRPQDFSRRIIQKNMVDDRKLTLKMEGVWLKLIEQKELGSRYYNLSRTAAGWPELTQEQRSINARKMCKRLGLEGLSARARKAAETLGPEGRSNKSRKANKTLGSEGCRIRALKREKTMGLDKQSTRARKTAETLGPEGRRARSLKGWITRKENKV